MAQGMKSQGYAKRQIQNQGPNLVNEAKKNLGQKTVKRSHNYQMYSQQVNNYLTLHQNDSNPNEISLHGFCVSPTQPLPGPATAVRAAPGYQSYREASHHGHGGHKNDNMAGPPSNKLILSLNNALEDVEQMNIHQYGTYNVKNNPHKNYFTSSKEVIEVSVRDASLEMVSPGGDYHGSVSSKQNQKLNKLKSIYRKKGGNNTASIQATAAPVNPQFPGQLVNQAAIYSSSTGSQKAALQGKHGYPISKYNRKPTVRKQAGRDQSGDYSHSVNSKELKIANNYLSGELNIKYEYGQETAKARKGNPGGYLNNSIAGLTLVPRQNLNSTERAGDSQHRHQLAPSEITPHAGQNQSIQQLR